ncbi:MULTISPECIES: DUF397 domain-containing protein [Streptomyces]|uniref:DUF397 domain-containing protein n=1 Tax=Streptomyces lienomycini TaxID=284035 RepID=A0ABV9WWU1_9ACTN|nr:MULTISPECIES: DUF397 domain-containing protein [Streptomyces]
MPDHIATETDLVGWRRSTYSGNEAGSCVEVVDGHPGGIPVRDSKVPGGAVVVFSVGGWTSFITALKTPHPPQNP